MKDVSGQDLQLGDKVAIVGSGVMNLLIGNIVRFTGKGCRVVVPAEQTRGIYVSDDTHRRGHIRMSNQVSFIESNATFMDSFTL